MKKILALILIFAIAAFTLASCGERDYFLIEDGVDYKYPTLSLEYVSYDSVKVTFSAEIYTFRSELIADIVLISEGIIVGNVRLNISYVDEDEPLVSNSFVVKLSYYNGGAIVGYVNHLKATHF